MSIIIAHTSKSIAQQKGVIMAKYVLCPRCELNYMQEGEEYCDVCKAELKLGPGLVFAVDEDEADSGEKLCPICKRAYIAEDEDMCEQCREDRKYIDIEPDDIDMDKDEEWRNYLDDDEKDMPDDDEMITFSQLADEERVDEFFRDDDEDDYDEDPIDNEPDDFDIEIDEKDFEDYEEEEEEDEDDDFDI